MSGKRPLKDNKAPPKEKKDKKKDDYDIPQPDEGPEPHEMTIPTFHITKSKLEVKDKLAKGKLKKQARINDEKDHQNSLDSTGTGIINVLSPSPHPHAQRAFKAKQSQRFSRVNLDYHDESPPHSRQGHNRHNSVASRNGKKTGSEPRRKLPSFPLNSLESRDNLLFPKVSTSLIKADESMERMSVQIPLVDPEAEKTAAETLDEYWNLAWSICSERFHEGNGPLTVSLELRDTWLRIIEVEWLDIDLVSSESQVFPQRLFVSDEPPLALAHDSWSRGALELFPHSKRESVLDPFVRGRTGSSLSSPDDRSSSTFLYSGNKMLGVSEGTPPTDDSSKKDTSSSGDGTKRRNTIGRFVRTKKSHKSATTKSKPTQTTASSMNPTHSRNSRHSSIIPLERVTPSKTSHEIHSRSRARKSKKASFIDSVTDFKGDGDGNEKNQSINTRDFLTTAAASESEAEEVPNAPLNTAETKYDGTTEEETDTEMTDNIPPVVQKSPMGFTNIILNKPELDLDLLPPKVSPSPELALSESFQSILEARVLASKSSIDINANYRRLGMKGWTPADCGGRTGSGVFRLKHETTSEVIRRTNPEYKRKKKQVKGVHGLMIADFQSIVGEEGGERTSEPDADMIKHRKSAASRLIDVDDLKEGVDTVVEILHHQETQEFRTLRPASLEEGYSKMNLVSFGQKQEVIFAEPTPRPQTISYKCPKECEDYTLSDEDLILNPTKSLPLKPGQLTKSEKLFFETKIRRYRGKYLRQLQLKSGEDKDDHLHIRLDRSPSHLNSAEDQRQKAKLEAKGIKFPNFQSDSEIAKRKQTIKQHYQFTTQRDEMGKEEEAEEDKNDKEVLIPLPNNRRTLIANRKTIMPVQRGTNITIELPWAKYQYGGGTK